MNDKKFKYLLVGYLYPMNVGKHILGVFDSKKQINILLKEWTSKKTGNINGLLRGYETFNIEPVEYFENE